MDNGVIGRVGLHVLSLVVVALQTKPDRVMILRLHMEEVIALAMEWRWDLAVKRLVQVNNYF